MSEHQLTLNLTPLSVYPDDPSDVNVFLSKEEDYMFQKLTEVTASRSGILKIKPKMGMEGIYIFEHKHGDSHFVVRSLQDLLQMALAMVSVNSQSLCYAVNSDGTSVDGDTMHTGSMVWRIEELAVMRLEVLDDMEEDDDEDKRKLLDSIDAAIYSLALIVIYWRDALGYEYETYQYERLSNTFNLQETLDRISTAVIN